MDISYCSQLDIVVFNVIDLVEDNGKGYPPPCWLYYKKKYVIISAFLISIIGGFVPIGHPFEFQRTLVFLPFFVLGYYSKDINITEIINKIPLLVAIAFFCVVFWVFYKYLNINMAWLLSAGQHYFDTDAPSMIIRVFSRLLWLPCSLLACVMFLKLADGSGQRVPLVAHE